MLRRLFALLIIVGVIFIVPTRVAYVLIALTGIAYVIDLWKEEE